MPHFHALAGVIPCQYRHNWYIARNYILWPTFLLQKELVYLQCSYVITCIIDTCKSTKFEGRLQCQNKNNRANATHGASLVQKFPEWTEAMLDRRVPRPRSGCVRTLKYPDTLYMNHSIQDYLWSTGCKSSGGVRSSRGDSGSLNTEAVPSCSFNVSWTATWQLKIPTHYQWRDGSTWNLHQSNASCTVNPAAADCHTDLLQAEFSNNGRL